MKRLIVCCDGTWDDADAGGDASNVVRLSRAIEAVDTREKDPIHQIVYYHSGVGTGTDLIGRLTGGAIGLGLSHNVRDAYAFIANNYCDGDELFLFGFSRGAYTARSIAGLIGWAGILHKIDMDDFALLWESFKLRPRPDEPPNPVWRDARNDFKSKHENVRIKIIGVWDTVGALGVPGHVGGLFQHFYNFHDTALGTSVDEAYQALAIDEHRKPYQPTLWQQPLGAPVSQKLEQVWFAGAHADIGGGYAEHGLSDITLAWMADRVSSKLSINRQYLFDRQDRRAAWGLGPIHNSATGITGWFGLLDRSMLTGPSEEVHESVVARFKAANGASGGRYIPANLTSPPTKVAKLKTFEEQLQWTQADPGHDGGTGRPPPQHLDPLLS